MEKIGGFSGENCGLSRGNWGNNETNVRHVELVLDEIHSVKTID